jgi:TolA-binding protein
MKRFVFLAPALALALPLTQIATSQEIEVRRALPVGTPSLDNYQNPAWIDRVSEGEQPVEVRRALPLTEPLEIKTVPTTQPELVAEPSGAPTPDDNPSNIRIAPTGAANFPESSLATANNFYARKMYDLAIPEYERFLISASGQPGRDAALFRLAECHRISGNAAAARAGYEKLLMEFNAGEFAAAGAYRLGEYLFADKLHEPASIRFDLASREATEPGIRLAAAYFAARSLDSIGKNEMAEERYRAVLAAQDANPYRENAAMALGALQLRTGRKQAALETYEFLAGVASEPDVAASAALQAAKLAREAGQGEKAAKLFDQVAKSSPDKRAKSEALIGALRLRYDQGDFAKVIETGEGVIAEIPIESRPEILQLLAAAHRQTGKDDRARAIYDRLFKEYPTAVNPEMRYQRLLSLYAIQDKTLPAEVDVFLKTATDPKQIASASLLKAESLYQQGNHAEAARAYAVVVDDPSLKKEQRLAAQYKRAWSLEAAGDHAHAIRAYSDFLEKYPNDKLAAAALLQRGLSHQKSNSYPEAIADFDKLIKEYSYSKEVELALLQKGLTSGHQKNYNDMVAAFEELLKKYPKTAAAAQANFWMGWVAYEGKDYKRAIPLLERARVLDPKNYGERASLRLILALYQLEDRTALAREVEKYKGSPLPADVLIWLAAGYANEKQHAKAAALLEPLDSGAHTLPPDALILLAETRGALGKHDEAIKAAQKYIAASSSPLQKARGLVAQARAHLALKQFPQAREAAEQALILQPEGILNAQARMVSGEIFFSESDFNSAARMFMAVSVLTDDSTVTPLALDRAVASYRAAGEDAEAEKTLVELASRFPSFVPGRKN